MRAADFSRKSGTAWCVLFPIITPHLEEPEFFRLLKYFGYSKYTSRILRRSVFTRGRVFPARPDPSWGSNHPAIKVLNAPRWRLDVIDIERSTAYANQRKRKSSASIARRRGVPTERSDGRVKERYIPKPTEFARHRGACEADA